MRALPEGVGKRMHIPLSRFEWRRLVLLAVVLSVVIAFSSFLLICSDSTEEYVAAAEGDPGWDPNWPVPAGGYNDSGDCGADGGNIRWYYYQNEGRLILAGHGKTADYAYKHKAPWEGYKNNLKVIELSNFIERIGDETFDYTTATAVQVTGKSHPANVIELPDNLKTIGEAFSWSSITGTLQLPQGLTDIGDRAFAKCTALTGSLIIPDSVKYLGDTSFSNCGFNGDLVIGNNVTTIGLTSLQYNKFKGVLELGDNITKIQDYAFREAGTFTELKMGPNITYIGENAFADCKISKGSIYLPKVNYIGTGAFSNCHLGGTLTIPTDVTGWEALYIGDSAFRNCDGLTGDLTLPPGAYLEDHAFDGCTGFDGTLSYDSCLANINEAVFKNCSGFKTLILPEEHWFIEVSAFEGCSGFSNEINLNNICKLSAYAFAGCTNLKVKLDFYNFDTNWEYIGEHAFEGCTCIEEVRIAANIEEIREYAFAGCTGLKKITVEGDVEKIKWNAFENCTGLTTEGISIRDDVEINDCAFQGCTGFNGKLVINGSWKIGANVFTGCTNLLTVKVEGQKNDGKINGNAFGSHTFYDMGGQNPISTDSGDFFGKTYAGSVITKLIQQPSDVNCHSVSYDADGGSDNPPISPDIAEGIEFTVQSYSGTNKGKTFGGWYYNGTSEVYQPGNKILMGANDIYLKAKWDEPPKYKITYRLDGGSGTAPTHSPIAEGEKFLLASYDGTKDGYYYEGWKYNGNIYRPGTEMTMGTSEMVFMAAWSSKPVYKVVYNIDGGSGEAPATQYIKEGFTYTLASYTGTKDNCLFKGWIYDGKVYEVGHEMTMGTKDVQMLANWIPLHSVTYDLNGGTGDAPVQDKVAEGDDFTVQECTATKEGYWLNGWIYINDLYRAGDKITMDAFDIILVADWKEGYPAHMVTYDINGGSGEAPKQDDVRENSTFLVKTYSGTKDGFIFKGWSYNNNTYKTGDKITMGKENIVLKAIWEEEQPFMEKYSTLIIAGAIAAGAVLVLLFALFLYRRRPKQKGVR